MVAVVFLKNVNDFLQRATSHYAHPWFVRFISLFNTQTLLLKNLLMPLILKHHTCRLTCTLPNHTYWCTSSVLLNILLVNNFFFFFDISPTFHIFFTLSYGSLYASSSSIVLDNVFVLLRCLVLIHVLLFIFKPVSWNHNV